MSSGRGTGDPQPRKEKEKERTSQRWVVLSKVTLEKEQALNSRDKERAKCKKRIVYNSMASWDWIA